MNDMQWKAAITAKARVEVYLCRREVAEMQYGFRGARFTSAEKVEARAEILLSELVAEKVLVVEVVKHDRNANDGRPYRLWHAGPHCF